MRISRLAAPACALLPAAAPLSPSASITSPSTAFLPYGQGPATQLTATTDRGLSQGMSLGGRAVAAQPGTSYGADYGADGTYVANLDNSNRTKGFAGKKFADGTATFTVPRGHYLVLCYFRSESHHKLTGTHVVVLPQVTVAGNTTAAAGAAAADSRVQVVTPRPAGLQWVSLDVYRWTEAHQLLDANAYSQHQGPIWINPASTAVTVGSLRTSVAAGLVSPQGTTQPYLYNLVLESPPGRIPAMREVVSPARLATVTARYYQAARSLGELYQRGLLPFQGGIIYGGFWFDEYAQARAVWTGGQLDAHQAYLSGQQITQNWDAYPLHSAPDASILGSGDPWARQVPDGVVPTADRTAGPSSSRSR